MSVPVRSVPKASAAQPIPHYIGGARVPGSGAASSAVFNPATGAQTGLLPLADAAQVDAAVQAAQAAFPAWAATPPQKRARVMFKLRDILEARADELAAQITAEHGKTHSDALGEVSRGLEVVEFACGIPHLLKGEVTENVAGGVDAHSFRQPLGVVAGITPFNFPAMVPLWMAPIAIACGNCLRAEAVRARSLGLAAAGRVVRRSRAAARRVQRGARRQACGRCPARTPEVKAISFVGSTPIAKYIYETGARHGKRVQALGGAKNHMLVMPDADLDQVADALMGAGYGSAGERCMAISVATVVGDETADACGASSRRACTRSRSARAMPRAWTWGR
jgi:malonate-semialdehyde dehydrogenase (acetylating)/methylmalonate-semialdehyde dehydrogenase